MKKNFLIKTKTGSWETTIWWDKNDRAYLVKVLHLPGVATFGKTLGEAKKMAKDAIELSCECLVDEGNFTASKNIRK